MSTINKIESNLSDNLIGNAMIVYQIKNIITNRKYIGITANSYDARMKSHFTKLENGDHWINELQDDFNIYGKNSFACDILYETKYIDSDHRKIVEKIILCTSTNLYNLNKSVPELKSYKRKKSENSNKNKIIRFYVDRTIYYNREKDINDIINSLELNKTIFIKTEKLEDVYQLRYLFRISFNKSKFIDYNYSMKTKSRCKGKITNDAIMSITLLNKEIK